MNSKKEKEKGQGYHIETFGSNDYYHQAGQRLFSVGSCSFISCTDGVLILKHRGEFFHYKNGGCIEIRVPPRAAKKMVKKMEEEDNHLIETIDWVAPAGIGKHTKGVPK